MPESERVCIYCDELKPISEFSLEHIIPQFLGGNYVPDQFKTRDVCEKCNNDLGLFVDAAFEKDYLISSELRLAAYALYNPHKPCALPLICMGSYDLDTLDLNDGETCELWLGPLGECIYWLRPHDERMYWYTGGNPRTSKTQETRAYFFFSERSVKATELSLLSFQEAFTGRKVKKIIGTEVTDFDMTQLGFVPADKVDLRRTQLLYESQLSEVPSVRCRISMNINFDYRFIAKLALGISHALFKNAINKSKYLKELQKALRYRDGETLPGMRGNSSVFQQDSSFSKFLGVKNAITFSILSSPEGVSLHLDIGQKRNWTVLCCESSDLTKSQLLEYSEGRSYVVFKVLQECIELSVPNLIAHNLGNSKHPRLIEIEKQANKYSNYFANL